jgi:hypothetical protein
VGLQFSHAPNPPQALPRAKGLTFFQINRDVQEQEWQLVERSLTLAVRLNEELVTGAIDGQRVLSLKSGSTETNLQLTLFVLMPGAGGPQQGAARS